LFSGIGGDDLASEWAGIKTVCFVEIDKYCQKVLRKHWPNTPIIEDVKDVTKERIIEIMADTYQERQQQPEGIDQDLRGRTIDRSETMENPRCQHDERELLQREYEKTAGERTTATLERPNSTPRNSRVALVSGGFPCQPHSVAGRRQGSIDERNLWPEFRRVIGEIKPRWVLAENVPGLFSSDAGRFFGEVVTDLAEMGYSVGWATYGAVDVGALHRRNRVFIVAYANNTSTTRQREYGRQGLSFTESNEPSEGNIANTFCERLEIRESQSVYIRRQCQATERGRLFSGSEYWSVEPNVGRVANGVPSRVDRLKCLGNAVVPQQVYPVYKAIVEVENSLTAGDYSLREG